MSRLDSSGDDLQGIRNVASVILPLAFPNALFGAVVNYVISGTSIPSSPVTASISSSSSNTTLVGVVAQGGTALSNAQVKFFAVGF
ncbi:gp53-like domain-containing protein [Paraburkholderia sp. MM5477-R1]|uniref:gp53-like domain-containing protein n=1 Tax=Paraburkholderia sp. MM5477-R1 TaxID=2991062 RepID=UPI003D208023